MTIEYICKKVAELTGKYEESEPERLAKDMGIILRFEPMGEGENACKGFFIYQSRQRVITINSSLDYDRRRIIMAHELGHAVLHKDQVRAFHDFSLYESSSMLEYEANLFAAELLLDDTEVARLLNEDDFFFSAAKRLGVPAELLDFKFRIMKHKGYAVDSPINSKSNFLRRQI